MYKINLSPYSKTFYYEWKLNINDNSYNIVTDQILHGNINIRRLKVAIHNLISGYLLLSSHIKQIDGELFWVRNETLENLKYISKDIITQKILHYVGKPFNLEKGPLYRFLLIKISSDKYRFITVCHHIIVDGLSTNSIIEDLINYYNNPNYHIKYSLDEQIQRITLLNNRLASLVNLNLITYKEFWKKELADIEPVNLKFLKVSIAEARQPLSMTSIKEINFAFSNRELKLLKLTCKKYLVTPFLYGQIIFAYLLYRYTGQETFGISFPYLIKEGKDFMYGAHINNIIMPYKFTNLNSNILDMFKYVSKFLKALKPNNILNFAYCPVAEIIEVSNFGLLDVGFIQTNLKDLKFNFNGIHQVDIINEFNIDLAYKLSFEQEVKLNQLNYRVKYNELEINKQLLERFIQGYKKLFIEILHDLSADVVNKPLSVYSVITKADFQKVIYKYNKNERSFPANKSLPQMFAEQANKTPNSSAIIDANTNKIYSYKGLLDDVNFLSRVLYKQFSGRVHRNNRRLIAVLSEKGYNQVITTLSIMQAGHGYVPLCIDWPIGRIEEVISQSHINLLLISQKQFNLLSKKLSHKTYHLLIIEDLLRSKNSLHYISSLNKTILPNVKAEDIAYVIFTSGSTGKPKGVTINHKGVANTIYAVNRRFKVNNKDTVLAISDLSFDLSVYDIFGILAVGGSIVFPNQKLIKDVNHWNQLVFDYKISIWNSTPQLAHLLIEEAKSYNLVNSLRLVLLSGDYIPITLVKKLYSIIPNTKVISLGGATEGSIWSIWYEIETINLQMPTIPYGIAMPNQKMYILDPVNQVSTIGAIGEICIGGVGVALNYWDDPHKTNHSFINHPYLGRIYRTGDMGRWHPDGYIEFMGRKDSALVKLRGYRIELEEIESRLATYPGITQTFVSINEPLDKKGTPNVNSYLIGYFVAYKKLKEAKIFDFLGKYLPEYMLPRELVQIKQLPLTLNGKLDKSFLVLHTSKRSSSYVPPKNKLEKLICQIFSEILSLDLAQIGTKDDFFKLGGNSILAIKLMNRLNAELKKSIDLTTIYKSRNISELVQNIQVTTIKHIKIVKPIHIMAEDYKLSFAQERLWFINKYNSHNTAYNVPLAFKLNSACNKKILVKSIGDLIERHEVLLTIFKEAPNGEPYQLIVPDVPHLIERKVSSKNELHLCISKNIQYEFKLNEELPINLHYYTYKDERFLIIVIHHIAFDGWSADILVRDLLELYRFNLKIRDKQDAALNLPNLKIQYREFAYWQRNSLTSKVMPNQLNYWKTKLAGYEKLNLPLDKIRPTVFDYRGATYNFSLEVDLSQNLRKAAMELNTSLYNLLLSGFYILLSVYGGQKDIILGILLANRHYPQIENLVGFFVNILALRKVVNPEDLIAKFINEVDRDVLEAQAYQDLPFEKLVAELDTDRDPSHHPIVQVVFGVQNFGSGYEDLFTRYNFKGMYQTAKFDLTFLLDDKNEQLTGVFEYATSLFEENTIKNYLNTYIIILNQLIQIGDPKYASKKLGELSYISSSTYKRLVIEYNKNVVKVNSLAKPIHRLFEEQVLRTPDNIAIKYESFSLSYQELNCKANQLANYILKNDNIGFKKLIALFLDKNELMIVAILAVLKSGNAYIPIEPHNPDDRTKYIMSDTQAPLILTNKTYRDRLKAIVTQKINIIDIDCPSLEQELVKEQHNNLKVSINPNNLAYIIYTSGTSGRPKGVMQPHNNITHLFISTSTIFNFTAQDVWAFFHSYAFDFSVWEIWGALLYGGKLIIPSPKEVNDLHLFYQLCCNLEITVLNQTPSAFYQLMEIILNNEMWTKLRYIIFGGEALHELHLKKWFNKYPPCDPQLINMYGITEASVHVTYKKLSPALKNSNSNIGKAIPDKKVYVLNSNLSPVPIGAIGELYIGGKGIAQGYLNLQELTNSKFIKNIFQTKQEYKLGQNQCLYRSGDLVRWSGEGDLEYIGRNDSQVKIRGYRIETSEIEGVIDSYPGIKQSLVVINKNIESQNSINTQYLIGYYVKKINITNSDLNTYIKNWKNTYESAYSNLDIDNYKENFIGWNSSYTGESISKQDMLEWRDETLEKIKSLQPKIILEIGSGTGLLAFNLIDHCNHYYATDFSPSSIKYIQRVIQKFNYADKITVIKGEANQIPFRTFVTDDIDTLVINSVAQYFPTLEYLETLLVEIIAKFISKGKIFIGDIRDYRLLDCFYYTILKFRDGRVNKHDIDYFKDRDKELLISPEYFFKFKQNNSAITHIEILPKLSLFNNEMSNFRYDVILHVDKKCQTNKYPTVDYENFVKVININNILTKIPEALYIKYPNKKILASYREYQELLNEDFEIKNIDEILSLPELNEKFAKYGYKVNYFIDIIDPLYLNLACYPVSTNKKHFLINYNNFSLSGLQLTNNPLINAKMLGSQHSDALRKYLENKLPHYMVPTYLIPLQSFPLNINGKLDYNALPKPDLLISDNYLPPRNDIEVKLCKLFAEVLGIPISKVGIRNNFFRLGGNSILAIKLITKINKEFNCNIKAVSIFINKTIADLTPIILTSKNKFELITHLNNTVDKINLFMIHPGSSGAEVYISLANTLVNYSCYGINNYNLCHKKKINNIGKLAEFYLNEIDKIREITGQTKSPYILLGWSLGGQIAVEIANILEQRKYKSIWIVAIDAPIADNNIVYYLSRLKINKKLLYNNFPQVENIEEYTNKILTNFKYDAKIAQQRIVKFLYHTKILVFKAMERDIRTFVDNYSLLNNYEIELVYNNTEKITHLSNIKLIPIENVNHSNIITEDQLIANCIYAWHNSD